jgi:hypothetical protein
MKPLHLTIMISLLVSLSACALPSDSPLGYKRMFLYGVPEGNDSFSQGWRDGCDTSLATVGTGTLRLVKEQINADTTHRMLNDPMYDKGFSIGSGYCTNFLDYNSG